MSKKLVSNAHILEMFKEIEAAKDDDSLTEVEKQSIKKRIHDAIVEKLAFLVYSQTKQYRSFSNYEDLVQEGFIGLVNAVQKFNPVLYDNFFGYADQWIRHSVKRAASRFDVVYNPNKTRVIYSEPDESEEDPGEGPETILFIKERQACIERVLQDFSEREREIVNRIFGLSGQRAQTLREIGPQFNLTHERVRQIKNNVIDKLRKHQSMIDIAEMS